jgi:hypothetical protein
MTQYLNSAEFLLRQWNKCILEASQKDPLDIRTNKGFVARQIAQFSNDYGSEKEMITRMWGYIKAIGTDLYWRDNISLASFFSQKYFPTKWEELTLRYEQNIRNGQVFNGKSWVHKNSLSNPGFAMKPTAIEVKTITPINHERLATLVRQLAMNRITSEEYYKLLGSTNG